MTVTLTSEGDRWVLRFERSLPRPPAEVWPALTTTDGLAAWFPARATFDLRVGAPMAFHFDDHDMDAPPGEVLEVAAPEVFAFAWGDDVLRFVLAPEGDRTRLTFTHRFGDRGMAARQAAGWEACLDRLAGGDADPERVPELVARYAERFGEGGDAQVGPRQDGRRRLRFERYLSHAPERVWRALTEPGELGRWLAVADELDLRAGGDVVLRWQNTDQDGNQAVLPGTITELVPPRLLEYELDVHGRLRWEVLAQGEGCFLTLLVDVPVPDGALPLELAGWHTHLDHLDATLGGDVVDWERWDELHRPAWQAHHDRYAERLGAGAAT